MLTRYMLLFYVISFSSASAAYAEDKVPELPDFSLYGNSATVPKAPETPTVSNSENNNKQAESPAYDVDVKTQAVPDYVLNMLNSQNVDINALASNIADEQLEKQKVELQKKKQAQEQQEKLSHEAKLKEEEEHQKRVEQEAKKQAAILEEEYRKFYYRPRYDSSSAQMEDQIHKKSYGPNNRHLVGFLSNDDYSSYLFLAVINEDITAIKGLLAKGAGINARDVKNGYTPLMYAIKNRKNASVDYLVSKGADLMVQANDGSTALHIAMRYKNIDAIKSLLYFKSSVEVKNKAGDTPVMLAFDLPDSIGALVFDSYDSYDQALLDFSRLGKFNLMQKAIKKGAKVDVRDNEGNTPLMLVIKHKDPQLVALLLQEKPNVSILNNKGLSAINIAGSYGDEYIWSMLKTYVNKNELEAATRPTIYPHYPMLSSHKKVVEPKGKIIKKPISLIHHGKK